jgi:hypothetical protein
VTFRCTQLFQLPTLIVIQTQPRSAAADVDSVLDRPLRLKVEIGAAAPRELRDHALAQERELLRRRGFEIAFQELTVPAGPLHELHIDPMHGDRIGEEKTSIFTASTSSREEFRVWRMPSAFELACIASRE